VTKQFEINAAHFQPGYPGKCANMHGHNYTVELTANGTSDDLDQYGMLIDFGTMKEHLDKVVGYWDHRVLNDLDQQPSIERVAIRWLQDLRKLDDRYMMIRVYETSRSWCEVCA
jgi:6-pyruvoyltetrahydropterin/6-carboxytetrahydropterin synthase